MTIKKNNAIAVPALAAVLALAAGSNANAEGQSWICQYIPSACASEDDPGGMPGHAKEGSASESMATSRGVAPADDAEPAPAAPTSAPKPAEPPAEGEDSAPAQD
jgi:hypothetical protein